MRVFHNIQDFNSIKNAVATVGVFDGVHLGHQKIISLLLNKAKEQNAASVVVTFEPHPRLFFDPTASQNLKLITEIEEKIILFAKLGIDNLIIMPFDSHTANLSSEEFVVDILKNQLGVQTLLLGYDHRFGRNREGSFEYLKENQNRFGMQVFEISRLDIDQAAVSSTRIRQFLQEGNCHEAQQLLNRRYSVEGIVIEGKKLGRTIGVPTANIKLENPYKLLPKMGVYAVEVIHNSTSFAGMLNIGFNPTVNSSNMKSIEVHIFDFDMDIYGQKIKLNFISRLRDEVKFDGLESLKKQLAIDAIAAREVYKKEISEKLVDN
jgi:riboflavin kinase / FMN adenylyltransferase